MKQIKLIGLLLSMLLGLGFRAEAALSVTVTWDTPGILDPQGEIGASNWEETNVSTTATSQTFTLDASWGYLRIWAGEDYYIKSATASGGATIQPSYGLKPISFTQASPRVNAVVINLSEYNGQTIHLDVEKVVRNETFNIDVINGLDYVTAQFNSGYTLKLQEGEHSYAFNPQVDSKLTVTLTGGLKSAYKVTLNGEEQTVNFFRPQYADMEIKAGDNLVIQVYDQVEPQDCVFTIEYGEGMEGCIDNIYVRSTGEFVYPEQLVDNSLTLKENAELRINLKPQDYNYTKLLLNGKDVLNTLSNNSLEVTLTEAETVLKIEGTVKVYEDIIFTGYIINGEGLNLSMSYGGTPFDLPAGTAVSSDIKIDDNLTMSAADTKKYEIPISEKYGKFFFSPKTGYYIENVFIKEGNTIEQQSGSASMSAQYDGTEFYMILNKMPEPYTAKMNITGEDFNLHISGNSLLADNWSNPGSPRYSATPGESEITFYPGYGTPITFGFMGDESKSPALYVDGAEATGTINADSGALEFFITPYSPTGENVTKAGLQTVIDIYNSFNVRPQMSGASLELEEGAEAGFFYSPLLHEANPAGQVVISGTEFTVRPADPKMTVTYKGEKVTLNENGEYVFAATGNARNNVVKVSAAAESSYILNPEENSTVNSLSTIYVTFPGAEQVEYTEKQISLTGPETALFSTDVHGQANEWYVTFSNPSHEGEYTVIFPAGTFLLDGVESEEIKAVYTLELDWQLIPTPGSKVESLKEIILSFPHATEAEYVGNTTQIKLGSGEQFGVPPGSMNCTKVSGASVPTFSITVSSSVKMPNGHYDLNIEEGVFTVDGAPSAEINVEYELEGEVTGEYKQEPESSIILYDWGINCAILFDETMNITSMPSKNDVTLTFNGTTLGQNDYEMFKEQYMLMFTISKEEYCKEGTLKLSIKEGAFMLGTMASPAIEAEWNVLENKTYQVEVNTLNSPDDSGKVNDLSKIYVTFPEAKDGDIFIPTGASLRTSNYSYSETGTIKRDEVNADGVRYEITFNPAPTALGKYIFRMYEGTITLDSAFGSPEIEETFDFDASSGIYSVLGDENGKVTVYQLDGKILLDKADAEGIKSLEKGVYIINGRKVVIR